MPANVTRQYRPDTPPPLENGDRLLRCEFERRYDALAHVKKAELIEGIVHMPSPVRAQSHAQPNSVVTAWLAVYSAHTPHTSALDNATVRLDLDNEPQPDALLRIDAAAGGQSRLSADDYVEGAPELVVEIAASSASYDMHAKRNVYRRNGVLEYIVWRVLDQAVDWFVLEDGEYQPLAPGAAGVVESARFPGLRLAVGALLAGEVAAVLAELRRGLDSPAHAAFRVGLDESRGLR